MTTVPSFDIFKTETDGSVLWRESAITIEDARVRARELASVSPGEYFILSHRTGSRLKVEPDEPPVATQPPAGQQA